MHLLKKISLILCVILLLLVVFIAYHMQIHAEVTAKEEVPVHESADIKVAAQSAVNISEALKTTYAARGVHAKGHACVKAYFKVNSDIAPNLRYGVFSTPGKQYQSWIRLK